MDVRKRTASVIKTRGGGIVLSKRKNPELLTWRRWLTGCWLVDERGERCDHLCMASAIGSDQT